MQTEWGSSEWTEEVLRGQCRCSVGMQTLKSRPRAPANVKDATAIDRLLQSGASSSFTSFRQNVNVPSRGRSLNLQQREIELEMDGSKTSNRL